jgi:hypothetical protein
MVWRVEDELRWGEAEEEGMEKHFRNKKDDLQTMELKKGKGWNMWNDELRGKRRIKGKKWKYM